MTRVMQTASILRRDVPWIAAKCEFGSNVLPRRARRWTFFVTAMGLCTVSGCFSHGGGGTETYTLFIDDAQIADVNHDGQPWCVGGALATVSVAPTMSGTVATTSEQVGLTPSWREPIADGEMFTYRKGLSLDVRGRCDGASFFMGRALLHPDAMLQGGGVALGLLGNVMRLRLHFERGLVKAAATDPSFGHGDDDYRWFEPEPTATDFG